MEKILEKRRIEGRGDQFCKEKEEEKERRKGRMLEKRRMEGRGDQFGKEKELEMERRKETMLKKEGLKEGESKPIL